MYDIILWVYDKGTTIIYETIALCYKINVYNI